MPITNGSSAQIVTFGVATSEEAIKRYDRPPTILNVAVRPVRPDFRCVCKNERSLNSQTADFAVIGSSYFAIAALLRARGNLTQRNSPNHRSGDC